jgi:hypothetical protein
MSYDCGGADMRLPMPVAAVPAATPALNGEHVHGAPFDYERVERTL